MSWSYRHIRFTNPQLVYVKPSSNELDGFGSWLNLEIDYGSIDRNVFSVFGCVRNVERVQSLNI